MLSTCSLALARTLDVGELRFPRPHPVRVRGARSRREYFWCWTLSFLKGFGFCLVNMSFSDRSDFIFARSCPATLSPTPPTSSLGCRFVHHELARVFAKSCGGSFKGVVWGFSARRFSPRKLRLRAGLFLPCEDREVCCLDSGDVLALLRPVSDIASQRFGPQKCCEAMLTSTTMVRSIIRSSTMPRVGR